MTLNSCATIFPIIFPVSFYNIKIARIKNSTVKSWHFLVIYAEPRRNVLKSKKLQRLALHFAFFFVAIIVAKNERRFVRKSLRWESAYREGAKLMSPEREIRTRDDREYIRILQIDESVRDLGAWPR